MRILIVIFVGLMLFLPSLKYENPNKRWKLWIIGLIPFAIYCIGKIGHRFYNGDDE